MFFNNNLLNCWFNILQIFCNILQLVSILVTINYDMNRNNMYENPFIKVYWIRHTFGVECNSLLTKDRNISCYQTTNLLQIWFLFLVSTNRQKEDKSDFVTTFLRVVVKIIFIKNLCSTVFFHWLLETKL